MSTYTFLVMFFLTDEIITGLARVASPEDHAELHACLQMTESTGNSNVHYMRSRTIRSNAINLDSIDRAFDGEV